MNQQQTIALLGATGKAGQYILQALLNKGYRVKALIRQPDTYAISHPHLEIVPGNIGDMDIAVALLKGCNAVIVAIGPRKNEPLISSLAMVNILAAMQTCGIKRYIGLTGLNLDVTGDEKSAANKASTAWMKQMFPEAVADKEKAFNILTKSATDWTMIRLPWIEQTEERRQLTIDLKDCPGEKISTADLAEFTTEQISDTCYIGQAPFVASL